MYIVLENESLKAVTNTSWGGCLIQLHYQAGPNLIDNKDNGRNMQFDIIEGWPNRQEMGEPWRSDAINPTQGGGIDNPYAGSPATVLYKADNKVTFQVIPKDYCKKLTTDGNYRKEYIHDTWPLCKDWLAEVTYELFPDRISQKTKITLLGTENHFIRHIRQGCHLRSKYFTGPTTNDDARDYTSWLDAEIKDDFVGWISPSLKLRARYRGSWDTKRRRVLRGLWYKESNLGVICDPKKANVVVAGNPVTDRRWIVPGFSIEGEASLQLEEYGRKLFYFPFKSM
jgi:hypothetical protein